MSSLVTKAAESRSFRNLCSPVPTASESVIEQLRPDLVALQVRSRPFVSRGTKIKTLHNENLALNSQQEAVFKHSNHFSQFRGEGLLNRFRFIPLI